jgi:hypothetical protein
LSARARNRMLRLVHALALLLGAHHVLCWTVLTLRCEGELVGEDGHVCTFAANGSLVHAPPGPSLCPPNVDASGINCSATAYCRYGPWLNVTGACGPAGWEQARMPTLSSGSHCTAHRRTLPCSLDCVLSAACTPVWDGCRPPSENSDSGEVRCERATVVAPLGGGRACAPSVEVASCDRDCVLGPWSASPRDACIEERPVLVRALGAGLACSATERALPCALPQVFAPPSRPELPGCPAPQGSPCECAPGWSGARCTECAPPERPSARGTETRFTYVCKATASASNPYVGLWLPPRASPYGMVEATSPFVGWDGRLYDCACSWLAEVCYHGGEYNRSALACDCPASYAGRACEIPPDGDRSASDGLAIFANAPEAPPSCIPAEVGYLVGGLLLACAGACVCGCAWRWGCARERGAFWDVGGLAL